MEINATDLRFNDVEVRAFLEQMGTSASARSNCHTSTNPPKAGRWDLQLAGLALARQPFDWNIPAGQTHIFEYLAEEVLRRETPEVQEFLKVSALFDRFCVPLCDHLFSSVRFAGFEMCGSVGGGGKDILAYLERANLFLVPLDCNWNMVPLSRPLYRIPASSTFT